MAYVDFRKDQAVLLNGFEAATFTNEYLHSIGEDVFGETDIDACLEYATGSLIIPLDDGMFGSWNIEPAGHGVRYTMQEIVSERYKLYYVTAPRRRIDCS